MNYRIVKTEPFKVFGIEGLISTVNEPGYFKHEGEVWNNQNEKREKLYDMVFCQARQPIGRLCSGV